MLQIGSISGLESLNVWNTMNKLHESEGNQTVDKDRPSYKCYFMVCI